MKRRELYKATLAVLNRARRAEYPQRVLRSIKVLTPGARDRGLDGPCIREIANHARVPRSTVAEVILELQRQGLIEKLYGERGGIRMTPMGSQAGARAGQMPMKHTECH